jgi:putative sterol carrier protein
MRSLSQTIDGMCLGFDPSAASGLSATIQFEVSGDEPGTYHLQIDNGECTFHPAPAEHPTLAIRTPSEVWLRISQGELSGRDALLQGLYEVEGDPGLLMRMDALFPRSDVVELVASGDQRPGGPIPLSGSRWLAIDFIPWIVLWAGFGSDGRGGWQALAASLALSASVFAYRRVYNRPTAFEVANLGVFTGLLLAWPWLSAWLAPWGSTVGTIWLGAIWLGTLLSESPPLTAAYSKWRYVPALWANRTFLFVNAVLTLMWGWVFVLQGSLDVWTAANPELMVPLTVVKFGLIVPASLITVQYPKHGSEIRLVDPVRSSGRLKFLAGLGLITAFGLTVATGAATVAGIFR